MRLTASQYLQNLLALQHSNYLLQAFGISPDSLAGMLRKSRRGASSEAILDTKSSFGEQATAKSHEVLAAKLAASLPPDWVQHTRSHENVKRQVSHSLRECAGRPPSPPRKGFKADRTAMRISLCQNSHMVLRYRGSKDLMILPLTCLSPYCPSCSRLRTARQLMRIKTQIKGLGQMQLRWITLTVRNCAPGDLERTMDGMMQAWLQLRKESSHGTWSDRVKGYLWALEVTIGKGPNGGRGWHPHIHILYDGSFYPWECLKQEWSTRLAARGLEGNVKVGAAYWTDANGQKHKLAGKPSAGETDMKNVEQCLEEVSKYTLAPIELKSTPKEMIYELANCLFRRHHVGSSGTLGLRNIKLPATWNMIGPLSACTDRKSKLFMRSAADQKSLTEAASSNPAMWANLVRFYEFFFYAEAAAVH